MWGHTHHPGIVHQLKVGLVFALLVWPRLLEVGRLADVIVVHLGLEAAVGGLGEHALLFHDGHDAQGLYTTHQPNKGGMFQ